MVTLAQKLLNLWELVFVKDIALPYRLFHLFTCYRMNSGELRKEHLKEIEDIVDDLINNQKDKPHIARAPFSSPWSKDKVAEFELDFAWKDYQGRKQEFKSFNEYLQMYNTVRTDWWEQYIEDWYSKDKD